MVLMNWNLGARLLFLLVPTGSSVFSTSWTPDPREVFVESQVELELDVLPGFQPLWTMTVGPFSKLFTVVVRVPLARERGEWSIALWLS